MFFYTRLALTNLKNNAKFYLPYLLSTIFTTALYYIISSLRFSESLQDHSSLIAFLDVGANVIVVFAVVFLLYANSFVAKNRKKQLSLYNILGMEKRHLIVMMMVETLITAILAIGLGLLAGIVLSQLMYLIIVNLTQASLEFIITVPLVSMYRSALLILAILGLSLLANLVRVIRSNPIDLLAQQSQGEKEPKTKIFLTLVGLVSLGAGYYLAISITDPMAAITMFFVAVLLVMLGTYCLFTAGSIALLKGLKANKNYYYLTRHFTAISGLIYRMKQNAVGLANICILCTCVLVTLSSTICLYSGIEDSVQLQCPVTQMITTYYAEDQELLENIVKKNIESISYDDYFSIRAYQTIGLVQGTSITFDPDQFDNFDNYATINILSQSDYNRGFNQDLDLHGNEIYLYSNYGYKENRITFANETYQIAGTITQKAIMADNSYSPKQLAIVVNDETIANIDFLKNSSPKFTIGFNSEADLEPVIEQVEADYTSSKEEVLYSLTNIDHQRAYGYELYGSMLFIGIFLSLMFMMAAVLIIYNKQLSQGYEDQNKFEILQNVGMSQQEVKQAIQSQILIFFFLPLVVSVIHLGFAYKLILNVLDLFLIGNTNNYFKATLICIGALVVIYCLVYRYTAKTYYQIVKK